MEGIISFIDVGRMIYTDVNGMFKNLKSLKQKHDIALDKCRIDFGKHLNEFSLNCNYNESKHIREMFFEEKTKFYNKIDAYNRVLRLFDDEEGYYEIEINCCSFCSGEIVIQKHKYTNDYFSW